MHGSSGEPPAGRYAPPCGAPAPAGAAGSFSWRDGPAPRSRPSSHNRSFFFIADLLLLAGTVVDGAVHIHPLPPGSAVVSAAVGAAAVFLIVIGPAAGLTVYVSHSAPPVAVSSVTVYHALPGNTRGMQRRICQTSSGVCPPPAKAQKALLYGGSAIQKGFLVGAVYFTSSMRAVSAASPRRTPVRMMRV